MEKKEIWTTSDIIANRNNWSLAADAELLKHLHALSEKIFTKANSTLQSLNEFEKEVNETCISVANAGNKFKALSDTQFIESKIQDESLEIDEPSSVKKEPLNSAKNDNITIKLKEALENGFHVLDQQYDVIPVSVSDSEDDEPQEILLRARNPYLSRRLPCIIGSEEFIRNDNLGLVDSSSSEEEEEYDEEEDESDFESLGEQRKDDDKDEINLEKKYAKPKPPPPPEPEPYRPQVQVIRISSSDSEDSDISIPSSRSSKKQEKLVTNENKPVENQKEKEPIQTPYSFADHLNAALKNNRGGNPYTFIPPDFGDTFSPPPFPGKDINDSSDDESSDTNVDLFAAKKITKHSTSVKECPKSNDYEDESEDNDDLYDNQKLWPASEINVISREPPGLGKDSSSRKSSIVSKTSQYSDSSSNTLDDELPKRTPNQHSIPSQPPKPIIGNTNINSMNKKMVTAINAELNEKLKIKNTKLDDSRSVKTPPSKSPVIEPSSVNVKKEIKKPVLFDEIDKNDDTKTDLFSGLLHSKPTPTNLFEEDDIESLFKSPKSSSKDAVKKPIDDLFSKPKTEKIQNENTAKPATENLFKKSNLFASDSDSEDDIFSIIKNQAKTTSKPINILNKDNLSGNNVQETQVKQVISTSKTSAIETKPQLIENDTLIAENLQPIDTKRDTDSKYNNPSKPTKPELINIISTKNLSDKYETTSENSDHFDDNDLFGNNTKLSFNRRNSGVDRTVNTSKSIDSLADNVIKSDTPSSNEAEQSTINKLSDEISNTKFTNRAEKSNLFENDSLPKKYTKDSHIFSETSENDQLQSKDIFKDLINERIKSTDDQKISSVSKDSFNDKFNPEVSRKKDTSVDIFGEKAEPTYEETKQLFSNKPETVISQNIVQTISENLFDEKSSSLFANKREMEKSPEISSNEKSINTNLNTNSFNEDNSMVKKSTQETNIFNEKSNDELPDSIAQSNSYSIKNDIKPEVDEIKKTDHQKNLFQSDSDSDDLDSIKNAIIADPPLKQTEEQESKKSIEIDTEAETEEKIVTSVKDKIKKLSHSSEENNRPSPERSPVKILRVNKPNDDEQDGNSFTKSSSPEPLTRNVPGKLAVSRGLNINVNALLPGTNWSSKIKQKQVAEPVIDEPQNDQEKPTSLLNNVIKERAKVSTRRRPPSRQARKSRILNDDVFGDIGVDNDNFLKVDSSPSSPVESKPEIDTIPELSSQIEINEKSKVKPSVVSSSSSIKDDLFGDKDDVDDLFQTIGRTVQESKKLTSEVKENQLTQVSISKTENEDFDFTAIHPPSTLPGLTKDRVKPQKRSSKRNEPDKMANVLDKKSESTDSKVLKESDVVVDKTDIFIDSTKLSGNSNFENITKTLFDDVEEDNDLFNTLKVKNIAKAKEPEAKKDTKAPAPNQQKTHSQTVERKSTIDIFNDNDADDELFSSKKLPGNKISKKSFLFEDEDGDDLFGTKSSQTSRKKTTDSVFSATKTKISNEKPRVVKLRSEAVQKDPLTGKDLSNLG